MIEIENVETAEETSGAARSKIYRLLGESLKYPSGEFFEMVEDGTFLDGVYELTARLPYVLSVSPDHLGGWPPDEVSYEDVEVEFIRVFDVGPGSPPCPLREGMYQAGRMSTMEELVRFYNHFGLSTTKGEERERPDSICTELEFLHYLSFKEVAALQHGQDPAPYRRAQRDFLKRHPVKWLPMLIKKLDTFIGKDFKKVNKSVLLFYRDLFALTECFARRDLDHMTALCDEDG